MSELYDILVETPPTKVILLALDQGLWDCERSLNELAALCEANHMEAVASLGGMEVIDRTMLILEIFRSRAVTNEGKLQTELALLRYRLPRLQGMGESLSRQGGGGSPPRPRPHRRAGRKAG